MRDTLLGLTPKDYDVATDAPPAAVRQLLPRSRAVGEAFGVVLVNQDGAAVEVATFRSETTYSDGRRPDHVEFTDARHDAQRRDFTINGLFADPLDASSPGHDGGADGAESRGVPGLGRVIDYVGGLADLDAGVLRAIGDPDERFAEDYLRMLRAVRFTARFGLKLDRRTAAAIRNNAPRLGAISRERVGMEVRAMLEHPRRAQAAALLQQLRLDGPALKEDASQPTPSTLHRLDDAAAYPTTLGAWMLDRHGLSPALEQVVRRWRSALCLSNDDRDALRRRVRQALQAMGWSQLAVAARKRLAAAAGFDQTLLLLRAARRADAVLMDLPGLQDDGVGLAPEPLVTGEDLIALGLRPGPGFKRLLDGVYDAQLEGRVRTAEGARAWVNDAAGG